jgi:hypothetical protein
MEGRSFALHFFEDACGLYDPSPGFGSSYQARGLLASNFIG